jgi:hypothetical protein
MFKRVIYDNWTDWVPYISFGVTALVFLTFTIRAMTMRKDSADRMARLPLDD